MSNEIDYGPLTPFIGNWSGQNGKSSMGPQEPILEFREELNVDGIGHVKTGEQDLVACYFVRRAYSKADDSLYHHESGYFMWDGERSHMYKCAAIPRGESYVALSLDRRYSFGALGAADEIAQSPYLQAQVKMVTYSKIFAFHNLSSELSYREEMVIQDQVRRESVEHILSNDLVKV